MPPNIDDVSPQSAPPPPYTLLDRNRPSGSSTSRRKPSQVSCGGPLPSPVTQSAAKEEVPTMIHGVEAGSWAIHTGNLDDIARLARREARGEWEKLKEQRLNADEIKQRVDVAYTKTLGDALVGYGIELMSPARAQAPARQ